VLFDVDILQIRNGVLQFVRSCRLSKSLIEQARNKIAELVSAYDQAVTQGKLHQFGEPDQRQRRRLEIIALNTQP